MKWGLWSTTAASNSNTPPDGWPEGQAPSTVNDCAREMMAQIAVGLQDIQFVDLGYTPTLVSGNQFTVSGTHATTLHYGRRLKMSDGANTFYGTIISSTATTNTAVLIRFDAGNAPLDSSLSAIAVGSPSPTNGAVPENVYRNRDYLDNSQFDVWQRGYRSYSISAAVTTATRCWADRWVANFNAASAGFVCNVFPAQRTTNASNVPTVAQCGVLLKQSYAVSIGTAMTGIGAGDSFSIQQNIEGYTWRQLAQKPMAFAVWVRSGVTGTYCLRMRNGGADQSLVTEYQISSVDTWEKKTFAFPPSPSTGTWDYSTGVGLALSFVLAAGSNFVGGPGNWTATSILATVNQVNFMGNAGKVFMVSAPKLEEGEACTPIDAKDYITELDRCQRYLQAVPPQAIDGLAISTAQGVWTWPFNKVMRATSLSGSATMAVTQYVVADQNNVGRSVSTVATVTGSRNAGVIVANVVGAPFVAGVATRFESSAGVLLNMFVFKSEP